MATTFAELFGIATACDYPDPTDVRQGTTFDSGNQTGTLIVTPPIAPTPGTAGPITIQGGLISTTATLVGDVFEFQRLDNPTFAPGDVTITIGGVTTNTTNLPQTINGELVLELTEDENVIGAVIVIDNPAWTRVEIEVVEGGFVLSDTIRYTDTEALFNEFGRHNVLMWADLNNDNQSPEETEETTARIDYHANIVSREIDDRLKHLYTHMPFNPVPTEIRDIATAMTGRRLYRARGIDDENKVVFESYEKSQMKMRKILARHIILDAPHVPFTPNF